MPGRKSFHEVEVRRYGNTYCIESRAFEARTGSVESTGVSNCVISSRVGGTITEVTKDIISFGKVIIFGSPYASQRPSQIS